MSIDYSLLGHCSSCHKNMIIEQAVGGKIIKRFTSDYSEVEYLLSDGSKMRVPICVQCQNEKLHEDVDKIMETEICDACGLHCFFKILSVQREFRPTVSIAKDVLRLRGH